MTTAPPWLGTVEPFIDSIADQEAVLTVCDILSNERRQLVVLYLLNQGQNKTVDVSSLASWIAAIEDDSSQKDATGKPYKRVRTALKQTHLQLLDEVDVVAYNHDRNEIEVGPDLERVGRVLLLLLLVLPNDTVRNR